MLDIRQELLSSFSVRTFFKDLDESLPTLEAIFIGGISKNKILPLTNCNKNTFSCSSLLFMCVKFYEAVII